MAKLQNAPAATPPWPRLSGQRIVLAGSFADRQVLEDLLAVEGGILQDAVSTETDYLILGAGGANATKIAERAAEAVNRQGKTAILIEPDSHILGRLVPSQDELLTLLKSPGGLQWIRLFRQACVDWVPSLADCDLSNAELEEADLRNFDLSRAKLARANLSGADLRCARLRQADLTDAVVDGAHFDDADVVAAKISSLQIAAGKGIRAEQVAGRGTIGPQLRRLAALANAARSFETQAKIQFPSEDLTVSACVYGGRAGCGVSCATRSIQAALPDVLLHISNYYYEATLDPASVKARIVGGTTQAPDWKRLAVAAWCEAFGIDDPDAESVKAGKKLRRAEQQNFREEMLAELTKGPAGMKRWNERMGTLSKTQPLFRRAELPGVKLGGQMMAGVDFSNLDLQESNFAGADLTHANFYGCDLRRGCLRGAILNGASFHSGKFHDADFSEAKLKSASLHYAIFRGANFQGADLRDANFQRSELAGADFTGAKLKGAVFDETKYDEATKWPASFQDRTGLIWKGKGDDPALPKVATTSQGGLAMFLEQLRQHVERSRYDNALRMLKGSSFQLFAQIEPDSLMGVVKSQTDPDVVYSCRLASDGQFACCTQNLRICGGLRGSLCKHLLVLIIGLAQSGELDLTSVNQWIESSRAHKPDVDREMMSQAFLRYKGAEAGEIDWRPTETIPEDYYSL
jgi:uncharacterized protein YjbI with pentapeptide repeats